MYLLTRLLEHALGYSEAVDKYRNIFLKSGLVNFNVNGTAFAKYFVVCVFFFVIKQRPSQKIFHR